jgi:hypothetical protein
MGTSASIFLETSAGWGGKEFNQFDTPYYSETKWRVRVRDKEGTTNFDDFES